MAAPVMPRPGPMLSACDSPAADLLKANIDCRFCGLDDTDDSDDTDDDDDPDDAGSDGGDVGEANTPGFRTL